MYDRASVCVCVYVILSVYQLFDFHIVISLFDLESRGIENETENMNHEIISWTYNNIFSYDIV